MKISKNRRPLVSVIFIPCDQLLHEKIYFADESPLCFLNVEENQNWNQRRVLMSFCMKHYREYVFQTVFSFYTASCCVLFVYQLLCCRGCRPLQSLYSPVVFHTPTTYLRVYSFWLQCVCVCVCACVCVCVCVCVLTVIIAADTGHMDTHTHTQ